MRLLIGITASDEFDTIGELASRLERGARRLAPDAKAEMVLGYHDGDPEVLRQWEHHRGEIPRHVRCNLPGSSGRSHTIHNLLEAAVSADADYLLLVDGALRGYEPANVPRLVDAAAAGSADLTLPVWCRPRLESLVTNSLLCPLLYATYRCRVRQPAAGHALLSRALVTHLLHSGVADGRGADLSMTMAALAGNFRVEQPCLPPLRRGRCLDDRERAVFEVARYAFAAVRDLPATPRAEVQWPERYWDRWPWRPSRGSAGTDYGTAVRRHARTERRRERLEALLMLPREEARELWARRLAHSIHAAREGTRGPAQIAAGLLGPFFAHAWHQQESGATRVDDVEQDVHALSTSTARWLGLLSREVGEAGG